MLITSLMRKNINVASDKSHSMVQLLRLYYVRCHRTLLYVHTFAPALTWILIICLFAKSVLMRLQIHLASYRPEMQIPMNKRGASEQTQPEKRQWSYCSITLILTGM